MNSLSADVWQGFQYVLPKPLRIILVRPQVRKYFANYRPAVSVGLKKKPTRPQPPQPHAYMHAVTS